MPDDRPERPVQPYAKQHAPGSGGGNQQAGTARCPGGKRLTTAVSGPPHVPLAAVSLPHAE
jgi:hypothetical protein